MTALLARYKLGNGDETALIIDCQGTNSGPGHCLRNSAPCYPYHALRGQARHSHFLFATIRAQHGATYLDTLQQYFETGVAFGTADALAQGRRTLCHPVDDRLRVLEAWIAL